MPTRREAILDAALATFEERGYEAATIEEVRRRSGASIGSIYHHFGAKDRLAEALTLEGLTRYQDGLLAALEANPGAGEGVRAVVEHHVDWVAAHRSLARHLLRGRDGGKALRDRNRAFLAAVAAWLEPHVAAGTLRRAPLDIYHALWLGPAQEWTRHWLAGRIDTPPPEARRLLADAAWAALRKEPQA